MFLTADEIRAKFNIQSNAFSEQIDSAISSAQRKIRVWVGATFYAEAVDPTPPVDPDELVRYESVIDAHSWLTMYYLSRAVGSKYSGDGVIKQAQDAGSPAFNSQILTNEYLTPDELGKNEKRYYDTAEDIAGPYLEVLETATIARTALPQSIRVVADW